MNFYLETQIVEIKVPFTDASGAAIVPTDITAALYDGEDMLLMSFGSVVFDPAGVEVPVVIHGALNTLQGEELQEVRRLEVKLTHAAGTVIKSHAYAIEAEQSLQIMRNSFMTYDTALLTARQFVNLTAFSGDLEARQKAALVEAFRRICNLSMLYTVSDVDGQIVSTHKVAAANWHLVDADVFQTQFPTHFKRALRAAQLAEADELLQGNVVARKQQQGIASETIGESSVTFRDGFGGSGSGGIGATALALLSGYLDRSVRIGRA